MNKFFVALATVIFLSVGAHDAEAKRLGGGMSSGMTRSPSIMNRQALPAQPLTPNAAAAPTSAPMASPAGSGFGRWMGPLAGLAAGIGLAALFSHFGMGESMANFALILLLAFGAVMVFRLLFRRASRAEPAPYVAGAGGPYRHVEPVAAAIPPTAPAGFDVEAFVRQAKLNFVRLQAANDRGDMDDIRNFTTPEMFAEVQLQYQERGRQVQQTDVIQLDADLLDVSTEGPRHIASVRFHGQLRETANAAPEHFDEVWHLVKPVDGSSGWQVAGIQQLQ